MSDLLPRAVVFDCDGTLVDTERLSDEMHRNVLRRRGYDPTPEDLAAILGRPGRESLAYWQRQLGGIDDLDAFRSEMRAEFARLMDEDLRTFDDAVGVLRQVAEAGVPVAVASSSGRRHVEQVLERCGLTPHVRAVFGAQDTQEHKPHPAPYLAAAEALGVPATETSAVEDSRVGIASATSAGLWTVAVRRGHVPDADLAHADVITDELRLEHLRPRR